MTVTLSAQERVLSLSKTWKFNIGDQMNWASPSFDDRNWEQLRVPGTWEDQGFNGYDGFAWYRTRFDASNLSINDKYFLDLGYIDDCDEVYLNGKPIGYSGSFPPKFHTAYNAKRIYYIPSEFINFRGENTLAVRVYDVTLEGGIIRGEPGIYKNLDNYKLLVYLQGLWEFKKGPSTQGSYESIMAPLAWESQGLKNYDGDGWYRKKFYMPLGFENEELVVVLGKIDDFDKTYLNGVLIGETNDHRTYGDSHSYEKLRVYPIPKNVLKSGQTNILTVFVHDMGNIGGIYDGPLGITTRTRFERYIH